MAATPSCLIYKPRRIVDLHELCEIQYSKSYLVMAIQVLLEQVKMNENVIWIELLQLSPQRRSE